MKSDTKKIIVIACSLWAISGMIRSFATDDLLRAGVYLLGGLLLVAGFLITNKKDPFTTV